MPDGSDREPPVTDTIAAAKPASRILWTRSLWMRLGALGGLTATLLLLTLPESDHALRLAAQVQFMHSMATLACATFMNIGARQARHAPAFFLGGIVLYCGPATAGVATAIQPLGMAAFAVGWGIMIWSARDIDREG